MELAFAVHGAQASLKVINLLLHVFGILLMRDEAFTSRLTLTSVVVILDRKSVV